MRREGKGGNKGKQKEIGVRNFAHVTGFQAK
jgi:hypothetical protein